jgi:hypothetical protein
VAKSRSDEKSDDEVARLLALQIRLSVGNQARAIVELSKAGIRPSRIADLLGTSPGTVNVALQRSKKSKDANDG